MIKIEVHARLGGYLHEMELGLPDDMSVGDAARGIAVMLGAGTTATWGLCARADILPNSRRLYECVGDGEIVELFGIEAMDKQTFHLRGYGPR
jgi:hypothetical protein